MKDSTTKNKMKPFNKLFIFIFWIAVWQIIYMTIRRDIYVPSPLSVFFRLKELIFLSAFWSSIAFSIYRVIVGLILSTMAGVIVAIASGINRYIHDLIQPVMVAIKSTPVLSFIIIALIWFSSSNVPIFICFLMCFPVIWTNIVEGINNTDKKLLEMARVYGVKKTLVIGRIYIPSIMPYFSAACVTCFGLGWKVSVAAEVLSHPRYSIGSNLYSAKVYLDSSELFAWTLVVIILSIIFEMLFVKIMPIITKKSANTL